jgi:hypothetical protein
MSAQPNRVESIGPISIEHGAVEHLRYIRSTMEAAHAFTTVPGKGCIAMGVVALLAVALEFVPQLTAHWLAVWIGAALLASALALGFMRAKARAQGLSLRRAVAKRFFMTLAPSFVAGAILTAALAGTADRELIAGMWLLLYGAGLAACGLFAVPAVLGAGIVFMALGTVALWLPPGLVSLALAVGFGGIHILLGAVIARYHGG